MSKTILGIDVSKKDLVAALLTENSSIHKKTFPNNKKGFQSLIQWLKIKKTNEVKVCMEATGNYSTAIADFMYDLGYEVNVVNPACIKAFAGSKLSRTKTDELDAVIIAQYASKSDLSPYKTMDPAAKELRYLYRCLNDLKKQQTEVSNHLENKDQLPESVCMVWRKLGQYLKQQISAIEEAIDDVVKSSPTIKHTISKFTDHTRYWKNNGSGNTC